jgi:predicted phage tail protein
MKEIILHGILAKEFGRSFEMQISRPKDCIKALNANLDNFINRINDLASQGLHYTIIVDNKKIQDIQELEIQNNFERIDLVPLIVGSGAVIGAAILTGLATAASTIGATGLATFLTTMAGSALASGIVGGLVLTAVTMGLQMLMQDKAQGPEAAKSATTAIKESFDFSNKVNVAAQGSSIPIGYGRLKVGSQVVQFTLKAFQSQIAFNEIAKKFDENNTQVISTKGSSGENIGYIIGEVKRIVTGGRASTVYYTYTWRTQGILELRLKNSTGKILSLNNPTATKLASGIFWIKYATGSRVLDVNKKVGRFSG